MLIIIIKIYNYFKLIIKLIIFFTGFLLSNILDTTIAEFKEWVIIGAALIIASLEIISKNFYSFSIQILKSHKKNYSILELLKLFNYLKIGIIYGLIVDAFKLGSLYKNQDDEDFVSDLFKKVILNHHSFENDIKIHTPNWETDRIADMDMILIKMGVCEFLNFPFIPTKVTINEYIEIAKDYSSEKSGYFVNGVLDKLSREFLKDKKIVKVGRGLL